MYQDGGVDIEEAPWPCVDEEVCEGERVESGKADGDKGKENQIAWVYVPLYKRPAEHGTAVNHCRFGRGSDRACEVGKGHTIHARRVLAVIRRGVKGSLAGHGRVMAIVHVTT